MNDNEARKPPQAVLKIAKTVCNDMGRFRVVANSIDDYGRVLDDIPGKAPPFSSSVSFATADDSALKEEFQRAYDVLTKWNWIVYDENANRIIERPK